MNQTKLSKQQRRILGWLYIAELYPDSLRHNDAYSPQVGLRALREVCIPVRRRQGKRVRWKKNWPIKLRPSLRNIPWLWYIGRNDSASFSRSIRRLEDRGLVITTKHKIRSSWNEYDEFTKHDGRIMFWKRSTQRDTINLTEHGRGIARQLLTSNMKRKITVNKKSGEE